MVPDVTTSGLPEVAFELNSKKYCTPSPMSTDPVPDCIDLASFIYNLQRVSDDCNDIGIIRACECLVALTTRLLISAATIGNTSGYFISHSDRMLSFINKWKGGKETLHSLGYEDVENGFRMPCSSRYIVLIQRLNNHRCKENSALLVRARVVAANFAKQARERSCTVVAKRRKIELSSPITSLMPCVSAISRGEDSQRLKIGVFCTQGRRPAMEDRVSIYGTFRGKTAEDFVGVFDGHGGEATAVFAARHLASNFALRMSAEHADPAKSLEHAFAATNTRMDKDGVIGGTTALCMYMQDRNCWVAHVGDSRALYIQADGIVRALTVDHKPYDSSEKERIEKCGGFVTGEESLGSSIPVIPRVYGIMAVSRALGDIHLQPAVSPLPTISQFSFDAPRGDLILLASDGLFDVMSESDIVNEIILHRSDSLDELAQHMVRCAYDHFSMDNISVVILGNKDY